MPQTCAAAPINCFNPAEWYLIGDGGHIVEDDLWWKVAACPEGWYGAQLAIQGLPSARRNGLWVCRDSGDNVTGTVVDLLTTEALVTGSYQAVIFAPPGMHLSGLRMVE